MNDKAACHGQLQSPEHELIQKYISITRMHRGMIDRSLALREFTEASIKFSCTLQIIPMYPRLSLPECTEFPGPQWQSL